ncbi:MAG TPA: DUF4388 domain-containing protein [Oceanithermus profundus]|uniref:DUF4388 domain-containing protein n=1 Tax=Oceanithermus profundus TaxID=187137 RepID=A0A7C4ZJ09_9DEIN|nr:DUF4388 domain-containing protein [Oceanithermus profundus]
MLKGNLTEFPLGTLLQTLAAAGRRGALLLSPPWLEGRVVLKEGRLYAAQAGAREGWPALELLAGLQRAPFVFDDAQTLPETPNLNLPLETALARLLAVSDRWARLEHLPGDWQVMLTLTRKSGELKLTPVMLQVLGLVEGRTVARILEEAQASPIEVAEALDHLMGQGVLQLRLHGEMKAETLVALSFYGRETGVAYVDEAQYREWRKSLPAPFGVRIRSPRGRESVFEVRPRADIPGRVMLHDKDLRNLRAGRGVKLEVRPELQP